MSHSPEPPLPPEQELLDARRRIAELETLLADRALEIVGLEEREKQYRTLFECTPGGLLLSTPSGRILSANEAATEMVGYTLEEFLQQSSAGISSHDFYMDEDDRDRLLGELADKGRVKNFEIRIRHRDGHPVNVSLGMRSFEFFNRPHLLTTILDISDIKKAEATVRANEEYLRTLLDSAHVGILLIDEDTHQIVDINEFGRQLVGLDKNEIVGRVCHNFVCPALVDKCPVTDLGQMVERSERVLLDRHGREIPIHKTVTRLNYKGRNMLLESFVNIDELKRAQEELQKAHGQLEAKVVERTQELTLANDNLVRINEQISREIAIREEAESALRDSEERFRSLFENNHAVMLLIDPASGAIEDANPAAAAYYGYPRKELVGMNFSCINPQSSGQIEAEFNEAQQEGRTHLELRHRMADGSERDVEVFSGPIAVSGRILLHSIVHDITKRKLMEQQLKELATRDSLTRANNRRSFMERAQEELARSKRYDEPLSLLMIDIDYFKAINDTHGHQVGDEVLKTMTRACQTTLRETDVFGRIGGEEFAAVLIKTDTDTAQEIAERLREVLARTTVQADKGEVGFTVSIGVASLTRADDTVESLLKHTDTALYEAKRSGRNRVVVHS